MKKKIHIFAPLSRYGGREIEAGYLIHLLQKKYNVSVTSLINYYEESDVEVLGKINNFSSLNREVYRSNFLIRLLVLLLNIFFKKQNVSNHFRVSNQLIKRICNTEKLKEKVINNIVDNSELVIICAQLDSSYVSRIVEIAKQHNKPIVFRTTGTIRINSDDIKIYEWCKDVSLFLHHSEANASRLNDYINCPYKIVDQCAIYEDKLQSVSKVNKRGRTFLILSRLAPEKQIDKVIAAFKEVGEVQDRLLIYGKGELEKELKTTAKNNLNIEFRGVVKNKDLNKVFEESDCLIVSSSEEAGPLSAIESAAAGVLIISTKVGAMPERFPEFNYWYDGGVEELKEKMMVIKELSEKQMDDNALILKNHYIENFSLDKLSKAYLSVVESFIEK